ncbi:MAG TPA: SHOCT domain-containing protein [Thermoleophilaceae bacterium]
MAVVALLTVAVICAVIAVLSTWVKRQVLDTGNYTNTSAKLLADPAIQNALGAYLVNELFTNVDVAGQLRNNLPAQTRALAGPAAAGLREIADREAPALLARPRVQDAWRAANRAAHQQFINILNGGGKVVSTQNGEVTLDLHNLVTQLAATLGISNQVAAAQQKLGGGTGSQAQGLAQQKLGITLPPTTGRLVIMRAKQLNTAQDIAKLIRNISIIFTILTFVLFAVAIGIAKDRRRLALRGTGWCFVGVGISVLLVRRVGGNQIVDGLVQAESVKMAAHDAWNIGTSLLSAIAIALVIYGIVIVVAAWLAGPTRPATAVRRALAPSMRDRPWRVYASVALVYLLVLLWGPTPALRQWIPILLIAAAIVLGIELLRRQTAREFPDAQAGDAMRGMREWWDTRRGRGAPEDGITTTAVPPATAPQGNGARLAQLERLASLHDSGALTDDEYSAEKGVLLKH